MNSTFSRFVPDDFSQLGTMIVAPFVGRYDWKSEILHSGLSSEVQDLLFAVIHTTGLMQFEKSQIASELIAHFEDGLQRGKSSRELIDEFGDPCVAASLIRSSKMKGRSMFAKISRFGMWTGMAGLLSYLALAAYFYSGKPEVTTDYTVELNQFVEDIPENERAWNLYRDAFAKYGLSEGGQKSELFEVMWYRDPDSDEDGRMVEPRDGEKWDRAVKALDESQEMINVFRQARHMEFLGLGLQADSLRYSPEDYAALFPDRDRDEEIKERESAIPSLNDGCMIGILLPHIQSFRNVARVMNFDSRVALERGDAERATLDIETMYGIAKQVTDTRILICGLVGYAIQGIANEQVEEAMSKHLDRFSPEQLERIQAAATRYDMASFVSFEGEALMMRDMVQRVYTDDGNGNGRITPDGIQLMNDYTSMMSYAENPIDYGTSVANLGFKLAAPISLTFAASRREVIETADEFISRFEELMHVPVRDDDGKAYEKSIQQLDDGMMLVKLLLPAFTAVRVAEQRVKAMQMATDLGMAACRYKLAQGEFPESIDDIKGKFVDKVGTDPYDGKPLRYQKTDKGFVVYSVGPNLTDDQGTPFEDPSSVYPLNSDAASAAVYRLSPIPDSKGDWIMWKMGY